MDATVQRRHRVECPAARAALVAEAMRYACFEAGPCSQCGVLTGRYCDACPVRHRLAIPLCGRARVEERCRVLRAYPLCRDCENDESLRYCRPCLDTFGDLDDPVGVSRGSLEELLEQGPALGVAPSRNLGAAGSTLQSEGATSHRPTPGGCEPAARDGLPSGLAGPPLALLHRWPA